MTTDLERAEREIELTDIRTLLSVPAGRRFLARLMDRTGLFRRTFTGNSQSYFNEGVRDVGLWLMDELTEADADAAARLIIENWRKS